MEEEDDVDPYEREEMKPWERRRERRERCCFVGWRGTKRCRAREAFERRAHSSWGSLQNTELVSFFTRQGWERLSGTW